MHTASLPFVQRGDPIADKAWTVLDERRAFTSNTPAIQSVFGQLQSGGGFFNGQQNIERHDDSFFCAISPDTDEHAKESEEMQRRQTPSSKERKRESKRFQ